MQLPDAMSMFILCITSVAFAAGTVKAAKGVYEVVSKGDIKYFLGIVFIILGGCTLGFGFSLVSYNGHMGVSLPLYITAGMSVFGGIATMISGIVLLNKK